MDKGLLNGVIFLDLNILLDKLKLHGVSQVILNWFTLFIA